jgi:hypothetical protein
LSPETADEVLTDLRSRPVPLRSATVTDTTWPVGPTGETRIRTVRFEGATEPLPLLMYFHGGGWVLGDTVTHDRLVRELAEGVHACVVFVDYVNSPEAKYPTGRAGVRGDALCDRARARAERGRAAARGRKRPRRRQHVSLWPDPGSDPARRRIAAPEVLNPQQPASARWPAGRRAA